MSRPKYLSFLALFLFIQVANAQNNPYKAPLYWNPYEYCYTTDGYIPETEWEANIDWVEQNLQPYGYNLICIDGWGDDSNYNINGYRTTHSSNWNHDYSWWANNLEQRGMELGIYNNPLWINRNAADDGLLIKGTNIPISSLIDESENSLWFTWVQVDRPGAEEYVKGYIQYYADMGVTYIRVDFLSWFEDGFDKNLGTVGVTRPISEYRTALRWMREACDANGIFLSLVMPHLKNEAESEIPYGHMVRINEDVGNGQWERFNNFDRGIRHNWWSQWYNTFDGYTYWSHISGRNKMILDGDFIRLNTMANDEEKKTVISLHLMAGGPLSVADQYNTIGNDLWLYQNSELLALNQDGFVGKPLFTNDPTDEASQVWAGQMSNGDWIVGLFNRENDIRNRSLDFKWLGIDGSATVRDLWRHEDLGIKSSYSVDVPPHGCVILKVVPATNIISGATYKIKSKHSLKALDVMNNSMSNGGNIHQWEPVSVASQKWTINNLGNDEYNIISQSSGKSLEVEANLTADGANVQQWDFFGNDNQKWKIESIGSGFFKIRAVHSGKVLDIASSSMENGGNIHQWEDFGLDSQTWFFETVDVSTTKQVISKTTKMENDSLSSKDANLVVYPNPFDEKNDILLVRNNSKTLNRPKIKIFDLQGKVIYDQKVKRKEIKLQKSTFHGPGIYIVLLENGDRRYYQRIIVK